MESCIDQLVQKRENRGFPTRPLSTSLNTLPPPFYILMYEIWQEGLAATCKHFAWHKSVLATVLKAVFPASALQLNFLQHPRPGASLHRSNQTLNLLSTVDEINCGKCRKGNSRHDVQVGEDCVMYQSQLEGDNFGQRTVLDQQSACLKYIKINVAKTGPSWKKKSPP